MSLLSFTSLPVLVLLDIFHSATAQHPHLSTEDEDDSDLVVFAFITVAVLAVLSGFGLAALLDCITAYLERRDRQLVQSIAKACDAEAKLGDSHSPEGAANLLHGLRPRLNKSSATFTTSPDSPRLKSASRKML